MTALTLEQAEKTVERFLIAYTDCLDSEQYADWPAFFPTQECRYEIRSRENEDLGLPAAIMYCDTHGMLVDRVTMLEKALTYRHLILRHFVTNIRVLDFDEKGINAQANYQLMQSDNDGVTTLYGVGQYKLNLVPGNDSWQASTLFVIVDTFGIDNMLAVPI